ncbi:hypothetical protein KAR48_02945 [bacterium]|nr:hypothetical protein [bacterium]
MNQRLQLLCVMIFMMGLDVQPVKSQDENVKEKCVYQYDVVNGQAGQGKRLLSRTRFNQIGKLTAHIKYDQHGRISAQESNIYDDAGRLAESIISSGSANISKKIVYEYDDDGSMIRAVSENLASNLRIIIEHRYDDQKNRIETLVHTPDNGYYRRMEHRHIGIEKEVKTVVYNLAGDIVSSGDMKYDDNGKMVAAGSAKASPSQRVEREYDADNNPIKVVRFDLRGRVTSRTSNKYDEAGNLAEVIIERPSANMKTRTVNGYNEQGLLERQISYNGLDRPVKILGIVYDFHDNKQEDNDE